MSAAGCPAGLQPVSCAASRSRRRPFSSAACHKQRRSAAAAQPHGALTCATSEPQQKQQTIWCNVACPVTSHLLGGLMAASLLLHAPAAAAVEAARSQAPIVGGLSAVLSQQLQSLPESSEAASPAEVPAAAAAASAQPQAENGNRRVFFDVAVDGEEKGRIVVQLYDDVPVGAARFADLAQGKQGVGFRRTKFDAINEHAADQAGGAVQDFIRDAGLRRLSFGSEQETALAGGDGVEQLEVELESGAHQHTGSGDVSMVVRTDKPLPTKTKLTAYRGKLVEVSEQLGEKPNGTAFAITLRPVPALDKTNLVVGKVVDGMDTVQALAALPAVKDNASSGYVKTAKFIGDRRADVAIRSFGRPFNKIIVAESGPLQ